MKYALASPQEVGLVVLVLSVIIFLSDFRNAQTKGPTKLSGVVMFVSFISVCACGCLFGWYYLK